ncbi:MAG: acyltransferase family protein [Bacteroidaceae bacterium]|nr:acyltransferase family protein [Bacteroidaceae bacterium]
MYKIVQNNIKRDSTIDSLKGFLIILVILGHLIGQCGGTDIVNNNIWTYIYIFHMPLFILLSGYFSKKVDDLKYFYRSLLKIFLPLILFQLINILMLCIVRGGKLGMSYFVVPYWTLWYLLSLICWRVILQIAPNCLLKKHILILVLSICLSLICGLVPYGRIFSIQRTLNFFPFFLLGYYMRDRKKILWNKYVAYSMLVIMFFMVVFNLFPPNSPLLLRGADQYSLWDLPAKVYILICSFIMSISVLSIFKPLSLLASIGKDSLLYYLYHGVIISYIIVPLTNLCDIPNNILYLSGYCILIVLSIRLLCRFRIFRWFAYPLANLSKSR